MPSFGFCAILLLASNAVIYYPQCAWKRLFPRKLYRTSDANSFEFSLANLVIVATCIFSVTLSSVLVSTYATDRYLKIVSTHCGADTVNFGGSISAMFAEWPNMILWRLGISCVIPFVAIGGCVQYFMAQHPRSWLRLVAFIVGVLENVALLVLTVRLLTTVISVQRCFRTVRRLKFLSFVCICCFSISCRRCPHVRITKYM